MNKGLLTVEAIWFLAKSVAANPKASHPAYLKEAVAKKFTAISMVDRKDLVDYITGKTETSANIDITVPALGFVDEPAAVGAKRGREDAGGADAAPVARALRTRNSALQCDTNFGAVLDFFGAPRGSELDGRGGAKKKEQKEAPVPDIAPLKTDRFADVTKNEMNREAFGKDFADLGIDTEGGFLDAARPRALPRLSELAPAGSGGEARASGPAVSRSSSKPAKPRRALGEGARPIVIVPAGYGSHVLFNMYNICQFLEGEKFVTWDSQHKAGRKKVSAMKFKRRHGRPQRVEYEVTDKAPDKRDREGWARVVAVFVSGKEWQFKDWPFPGADEGDLVSTFANVRGFYAQYDTDKPAEIIKTWNVKTLRFQKNVRHGDRAQFEAFWEEVDNHLQLRRSVLKY
mgnify:CR=1 FL=1|jgi:parafibromin